MVCYIDSFSFRLETVVQIVCYKIVLQSCIFFHERGGLQTSKFSAFPSRHCLLSRHDPIVPSLSLSFNPSPSVEHATQQSCRECKDKRVFSNPKQCLTVGGGFEVSLIDEVKNFNEVCKVCGTCARVINESLVSRLSKLSRSQAFCLQLPTGSRRN